MLVSLVSSSWEADDTGTAQRAQSAATQHSQLVPTDLCSKFLQSLFTWFLNAKEYGTGSMLDGYEAIIKNK